jgi:hypothetical protein
MPTATTTPDVVTNLAYPNRVIKEGEQDSEIVTAIQQRLTQLGYATFLNLGTYGPKTTSAVKQFQATHRDQKGNPLEMDGKVGSITWAILFGLNQVPTSEVAPNDLLTEAVKIAHSQIGIMEKPPGSNRGPEVDMYLKTCGCDPGNFWCASFVYWCFDQAAKKLGRQNPVFKTPGCLPHWNKTTAKKIPTAAAINNPGLLKPGQIFIIDHGGGMGHTGIVERVEGGFIDTIEGNSDPTGGRNGIGVFTNQRKIAKINKGFIEYE